MKKVIALVLVFSLAFQSTALGISSVMSSLSEEITDPVIRTIKEQLMINLYGGVGGGQLVNSINAISKRSALFKELL